MIADGPSPAGVAATSDMGALVLDARMLSTGIGTYTRNLVEQLTQQSDIPLRLLTLPRYLETLSKYKCSVSIVDVSIYSISEQFRIRQAAKHFEVLHVPHYNAPLLRKGTLLVTIHDLNHILDRSYRRSMKSIVYAQPMLRLVARRADHIFTVSDYSKRQIMEHLGADAERITVVYNAIGAHIAREDHDPARESTNRDFAFDGPYILFVGNLKPSKNVQGLLKAFSVVASRSRVPHRLLLIGDDVAGRRLLTDLRRQLKLESKVISVPRVRDSQLRRAYSGADLTVLPSFEEGFGLPIVESMACGTPVACSRSACLPEIAGNAAEYFDPHDIEEIAEVVERVLSSADRQRELRQLGIERARRFTREAFAHRHIEVYRRYLGQREA